MLGASHLDYRNFDSPFGLPQDDTLTLKRFWLLVTLSKHGLDQQWLQKRVVSVRVEVLLFEIAPKSWMWFCLPQQFLKSKTARGTVILSKPRMRRVEIFVVRLGRTEKIKGGIAPRRDLLEV